MHCFSRWLSVTLAVVLIGPALAAEPQPKGAVVFTPAADFPLVAEKIALGACAATAVDTHGRIYLFHRGEKPILQLDAQGKLLRGWGEGEIKAAHGLRVDADDNVWVTDMNGHRVLKYSPLGELLLSLGTGEPGDGDDQFNKPTDIGFGAAGEFFISDGYGNSRVLRFSSRGKLLQQWGSAGDQPGEFHLPHSLVVDAAGRVLVGDRENDRIQVFTNRGKLIEVWNGFAPYGMAIDSQQNLFVADGRANQVLRLNSRGKVVQRYGEKGDGPGQFLMPHMLAFDAQDNLLIAEVQGKRLQKLIRLKANDDE